MSDLTDYQPASDVASERALLGCLLRWPEIAEDVWRLLAPSDFFRPNHETLAAVLLDMGDWNEQLVLTEIMRRGLVDQLDAPYLATLLERATTPHHAELHAHDVLSAARRRRLQQLAIRALQQASNDTVDVDELAIGMLAASEGLLSDKPRTVKESPDLDEFLSRPVRYDWLVPNLIERGDRFLVTGAEGGGKSVWLRQIGVCVAAGINPVTFGRIDPCRVMLLDLENSEPHDIRQLDPLRDLARAQGDYDPDRFRVECKPAGIDISGLDDAGWLADKVAANRPDLVIVGPLYRLHGTALDKEDAARAITVVLDGIRVKHRCALMIEAHAGHGVVGARAWRPAGSSLFMRWPEFGFGLKPNFKDRTATVVPWRGPRDERKWPEKLRQGGRGNWPWLETESDNSREMEWAVS